MEVETDEDAADIWVQGAAVGDAGEVFGFNVAAEIWVRAADEGDVFGLEFLFYACFAEDEDFVFGGLKLEDPGDVDGGRV